MKHPFPLATHTCYLYVIPFPTSGLNWIVHKPVWLLTAPGRLTAHPLNVMTQVKGFTLYQVLLPKTWKFMVKIDPIIRF